MIVRRTHYRQLNELESQAVKLAIEETRLGIGDTPAIIQIMLGDRSGKPFIEIGRCGGRQVIIDLDEMDGSTK